MSLCSFIQEWCAKQESIKTGCTLTFAGQCIKTALSQLQWHKNPNIHLVNLEFSLKLISHIATEKTEKKEF